MLVMKGDQLEFQFTGWYGVAKRCYEEALAWTELLRENPDVGSLEYFMDVRHRAKRAMVWFLTRR